MMDVGRVISYISISIVLLFGIAVTTGIFFDIGTKMRIGVGVLVILYCAGRFALMIRKPKRLSLYRDDSKGDESEDI